MFRTLFITLVFLALSGLVLDVCSAEPLFRSSFNESSFAETGWTAVPSGGGAYDPASVSVGLIPSSPSHPTYTDGHGLIVTAAPGQGSFLFGPTINSGGDPVLVRLSILTFGAEGTLAVGALNASASGGLETADGSVTYAFEASTEQFMEDYRRIFVIYHPKQGAIIPLIQLAVESFHNVPVTAMLDEFEVFVLNESTVTDPAMRDLFGISEGGSGEATPTPTITPTPTLPPADIIINWDYFISPTDDEQNAYAPRVAFDQNDTFSIVAADTTGGFQDIVLRNINDGDISDAFTVNQTFEDTAAQLPDLDIDFSGTRHVVWSDNRALEKLFSVYLTQINSFGERVVDEDFEVNDLFEDTNTTDPAVAIHREGNMVVVWRDDRNFVSDLFARRVQWNNDQLTLLDEHDFLVNRPFENTNVSSCDIAIDDQGTSAVVWSDDRILLDEQKRSDVYARIFDFSTPTNEENALPPDVIEVQLSDNDEFLDHASDPQVAWREGSFVAVWSNRDPSNDQQSIYGAVFNSAGEILVPEFIISEGPDSITPAISPWDEDMGPIENGNLFLISWYDRANAQVMTLVYDQQSHMLLTNDVLLTPDVTGTVEMSSSVGESGTFFVAWDAVQNNISDLFGVGAFFDVEVLGANSATSTPPTLVRDSGKLAPKSVRIKSVSDSREHTVQKAERKNKTRSTPR